MPDFSKSFEIIKHWDSLPDDAVVSPKITGLVLGCAERTVRYHPDLTRVYISRGRYGFRAGNIRQIVHKGAPNSAAIQRLVEEVSAAPDRAEAEQIITAFDDSKLDPIVREQLQAELADLIAGLLQ
jgi:hypothetical protein